MSAPRLECRPLLRVELMPLIDTDDAGAASADMAENGLDYLETKYAALHASSDGTPQVMNTPRRNPR